MRLLGLVALAAAALCGQKLDPIKWQLEAATPKAAPGATVYARLTANLEDTWHLYSLTTPKGGPIVTTVKLAEHPAVARYRVYQPKPVRALDPNFNLETETFEKKVEFLIALDLAPSAAAGPVEITANLRYQACTEKLCLPPRKKTANATVTVDAGAPAVSFQLPEGYTEVSITGAPAAASAGTPAPAPQDQDLGGFLLTAFGLGLAAIFTPCVFPMIPITVSFFSRDESGKASPLAQAEIPHHYQ